MFFYHYIIKHQQLVESTQPINRTAHFYDGLMFNETELYENVYIIIDILVPMIDFLAKSAEGSTKISMDIGIRVIIIILSIFATIMFLCLILSIKVFIPFIHRDYYRNQILVKIIPYSELLK